jgi:hypothetical protein
MQPGGTFHNAENRRMRGGYSSSSLQPISRLKGEHHEESEKSICDVLLYFDNIAGWLWIVF